MKKKQMAIYALGFLPIGLLLWRNKKQKEDKIELIGHREDQKGVAIDPSALYEDIEAYINSRGDKRPPLKEVHAPVEPSENLPPALPPPVPTISSNSSGEMIEEILPMPKLHLEYLDALRNPFTSTKTYDIPSSNSTAFTLLPNDEYLRVYKSPKMYTTPAKNRSECTLGDYYSPESVRNMIKYFLSPIPRPDASHNDSDKRTVPPDSRVLEKEFTFKIDKSKLNNFKTDLAYLLQIEMNLQSERANNDKGNSTKDLLFTQGADKKSYVLPNYSQIGDLAYSREGAAILWSALNRIARGISTIENITDEKWSPEVSKIIKKMKKDQTTPSKEFIDFVDDFMNGKYPNEIGCRENFVHYPRQLRRAKSLPSWAYPIADPKRARSAKNIETLLINDLLSARGGYDVFSTSPNTPSRVYVAPYDDPRRRPILKPQAKNK